MDIVSHCSNLRTFLFFAGIVSGCYVVNAVTPINILGSGKKVIEVTPEKSTGLDVILVANSVDESEIRYSPSGSASNVKWYKYSNLGGGYAEEIRSETDGDNSVLKSPAGDMGYIIEDGDKRYYFWLVDYSKHRFTVRSLQALNECDCDVTNLSAAGSGDAIHYFTINGQQKTLSREITVTYNTLEWLDSEKNFVQTEKTSVYESLTETLRVLPAVLCDTQFTLIGDRFLKEWGEEKRAVSDLYNAVAVEVHTTAVQDGSDIVSSDSEGDSDAGEGESDEDIKDAEGSNIIRGESSGLGGSAPAEITFQAFVSDAVLHTEWQMAKDADFNDILYRFTVQDLTYTFEEEGNFYVRFIGSNADGSCESVSNTNEVSIGASDLLCPNAFSPDGDGVNDEWKVSYRSLIDFHCWIFDRYGHELYHFDDASKGWDGKYKGKVVRPGVYYYVIQAQGADGKKYKKSGDINILRKNVTKGGETTVD